MIRGLIHAAALAGALAAAATAAAGERPEKPNLVLIFIDDMGYGDVGPFGNTRVKTPHLDRLAAEGMKFTSFYATPVCSMSRACLLTGCYNTRVSVPGVLFPNSATGLHPDEVTLAEVVKPKGYATACVGKWHLGLGWHVKPGTAVNPLGIESREQVNNVDYFRPFAESLEYISADFRVTAFQIVIGGLADIVEQASSASQFARAYGKAFGEPPSQTRAGG